MKKMHEQWKALALLLFPVVMGASCRKDLQTQAPANKPSTTVTKASGAALTYLDSLLAYKNSAHSLMAGYYRTWGDSTFGANLPSMNNLPDSMDIVCVFPDYTPAGHPYWTMLKNSYVPGLHAKGTKVVYTQGTGNFDYWKSYHPGTGDNTASYNQWAIYVRDSLVNYYGFDGYDMDVETDPTGATLTKFNGMVTALSAYFGPKSSSGKWLILDTNRPLQGSTSVSSFFQQSGPKVNYVFLQAYWRPTSSLQTSYTAWSPYLTPGKFLVGVDFEDGSGWAGANPPINQYALWQPSQGKKAGVFSYGIDTDYANKNDGRPFYYTRAAIALMNPPAH
ncbi:EndoS/ChiA family endoglycosidase [Chitinophaga vietnamensis]|uniref:EndoS/ChiA family endoglycosidase n=1 Tax=Chitinophaga vietnamensis TaxID=2593957 RepID=UPI0011780C94|nr:endo-beta-N-acetylglucosaminidase [Chitinophaga vietnamensis]